MEQKNIICELTDIIKNLDTQKVINEILQYEEEKRGINWRAVFSGSNDYDEKLAEVFSQFNTELGLHMDYRQFKADPIAFLSNSDEVKTVANIAICNDYPNSMMLDYIQGLRKEELGKYVVHMTQKLEFASQSTNYLEIALDVVGSGILSIGGKWAINTIKALRTSATLIEACVAGAQALSAITKVTAIISLVVVVVLIPFIIFMNKKAEMMMIIINRTPEDIDIHDYYLEHGKLVAKPEDMRPTPPKIEPHAILGSMYIGDSKEVAYAGIMYVTKRDCALIGVMGACKLEFSTTTNFPNGVHLGFSTPLAQGDNCGYITAEKYDNAQDFYKKKSGDFQLEKFEDNNNYHLQSCVNSTSGGEPVMIAVIQTKK